MPQKGHKAVLVVDDNRDISDVMQKMLGFEGYAVTVASDSASCLDAVRKTDFLVVLLDLDLAGASGLDVLTAIKKMRPAQAVIIVTGDNNESDAARAVELGAWEYITKPVDFAYLKNILLIQSQSG
jgi:DNA-binding NtrC family response regulator